MNTSEKRIDFDDGKYTVIIDEHKATALRYGGPWRAFTGDKLLWMMANEIAETRSANQRFTTAINFAIEQDPEADAEQRVNALLSMLRGGMTKREWRHLRAALQHPAPAGDALTVAAIAMAAGCKALPLMRAIAEAGEGDVTMNQRLSKDQALQAIAAIAKPAGDAGALVEEAKRLADMILARRSTADEARTSDEVRECQMSARGFKTQLHATIDRLAASPLQAAGAAELVAIGWMRPDGSLHKGCPPFGEPDGWEVVYRHPAPQPAPAGDAGALAKECKRTARQIAVSVGNEEELLALMNMRIDQLAAHAATLQAAGAAEQVAWDAWINKPVDWFVDGKPITMGDCIRNQCGELALSYVREAFRVAAHPTPAGDADVADIIAGALQTSRAHAYELMSAALTTQGDAGALAQALFACNEWADAFYNAKQHIKNLRDGITDFDSVLANLDACDPHCQEEWAKARALAALASRAGQADTVGGAK